MGRQILDDIIVANECVRSRFKETIPGLICKLDLEKAYDLVDWKFLVYMLSRMGFGEKWRKCVLECLYSTWISIMINGSPKGFFQAQKGLRQGHPLSPFLFLLVAKALGRMIKGAVRVGLFKGFRVARNSQAISHLQFADDTLYLLRFRLEILKPLFYVLKQFRALKSTSSKVS